MEARARPVDPRFRAVAHRDRPPNSRTQHGALWYEEELESSSSQAAGSWVAGGIQFSLDCSSRADDHRSTYSADDIVSSEESCRVM